MGIIRILIRFYGYNNCIKLKTHFLKLMSFILNHLVIEILQINLIIIIIVIIVGIVTVFVVIQELSSSLTVYFDII